MTTLLRILRFGFKNYFRNIWLSIAASGIMVITILTISVLFLLNWVGDMTLNIVKDKVDISIFLRSDVSENEINQVRNKLLSLSEVKTITFVSKEEALRNFQKKHQENSLMLSSIMELDDNPLQPTLVVKARYPEDYSAIADHLQIEQFDNIVEKVNYEDNRDIINKLTLISENLRKVGIGLSIVFGFVVILVVFNTVRLTIYTQKEEIKIMRLVGATNNFIRMPFIVEGILYGFIGGIIAFFILYPIVSYSSPFINEFLENQGIDITSYFIENIIFIIIFEISVGIILGIISSYLAVRRYLRGV